jgi:hypothetical protein
MDSVSEGAIGKIEDRGNIVGFSDGVNEYSFNIAKSTLYKRFHTTGVIFDLPVKILDDPFDALEKMLRTAEIALSFAPIRNQPHVFLPLYSTKTGEKVVPGKSGLNRWNRAGRARIRMKFIFPFQLGSTKHTLISSRTEMNRLRLYCRIARK